MARFKGWEIKTKNGTYKLLKLEVMFVDSRVNRNPLTKHIAEMNDSFDPRAIKAFVVSKRKDGTYSILDGCQEFHVLQKQGWTEHVCQIHENLTLAQECKLFNLLNNHKGVQPNIKFRNSYTAREKWAVDIYNVLKRHDFDVKWSAGRPPQTMKNVITCLKAIIGIVNANTIDTLDAALHLIRQAFEIADGQVSQTAKKDMFIRGAAIFINEYNIDVDEAIDLLRGKDAYDIEQAAIERFGDSRAGVDVFIAKQLAAACGLTVNWAKKKAA